MQALINAGGKGSRMGYCGIEKPMMEVGGVPTVKRVLDALSESAYVDGVLVSVSDNTVETEAYLKSLGAETVRTSGESFMDDLHASFSVMEGEYVMTCPSDLPLITTAEVDMFAEYFVPGAMESAIAVIDEETVRRLGIVPSYTREHRGRSWVLSGLCIMNRPRTLAGEYLGEFLFETDWANLAVNVNTPKELDLARSYFRDKTRLQVSPCTGLRPCRKDLSR